MPGERRSSAFCCAGCEAVHALLQADGLQRFYDLGGRELGAVGAIPRVSRLDWLPELEATHRRADGTVRLQLDVQGLRCAACVWLLQELWRRQAGARALQLDVSLGRATLVYAGDSAAAAAFLRRASALGYPMAPAQRRARRDTGLLVRLGIAAALAMNAMILAIADYCGVGAQDPQLARVFANVGFGLATLSVVVGGPVFFRAALAGLRAGVVHMDLPISLGLLLAYAGSVYGHWTGGAVWFDTVAMFVALMLGGRFVQLRALQRGRDQVLADDGAEHLRARRLSGGRVEVVPISAVRAGDELLLAPGDLVPVHARAQAPVSCSLDWINGESEPRAFAANATVPAGAFVGGQRPVRMVATADYLQSGLADLLAAVPGDREDPQQRVRFWTRWARSYSAIVLLLAGLGALLWTAIDATRALPVAIAVLVITCPCALGLAAPLSFHLTLARLRRLGVFVRTRTLLDKLGRVRKVVFDKTGTLTFGGLRAEPVGGIPAAVLPVLTTMAAGSNHPASQAVLAALADRATFDRDLIVEESPGQGTRALHHGIDYRLGSTRFAGVAPSAPGAREVVFTAAGQELARFALTEDYRAGTGDEIAALRRRGLQVHLLSGDRAPHVAAAAQRLGIDAANAHGDLAPHQKAERVRALDAADTLMVGDGLNDAPAFAVAYCAGTPALDRPVMPARADFYYCGAQAGAVDALLRAAAHHRRVMRTNLGLAIAYNVASVTLALADQLTPLLCAVLMPASSLFLIAHSSWRLGRRGGRP